MDMEAKHYLNKQFLAAAESLFGVEIKKYLDWGADVNCTDYDTGKTALHYAIKSTSSKIVKVLIRNGCKPDQKDNLGKTALHYAVESTSSKIVKVLNRKYDLEITALHIGLSKQSVQQDMIRLLIEAGWSLEEKDKEGRTALFIVLLGRFVQPDIVRLLIEAGCSLKDKDKEGRTALLIVLSREFVQPDIIRLLIEAGCSLKDKDKEERTALHIVLSRQSVQPDIIRLLIEAGCSLEDKDKEGNTALHYAAQFPKKDILKVLLEYGCKPNQKNTLGRTVLHVTLLYKYVGADVISLLLESGCNPNAKDKQGRTALHVAALNTFKDEDVIPLLINSGCNLDEKDKEGRTPLHVAAWKRSGANSDFILLLLNSGCNPEVKDKKGKTPLDQIEEKGLHHYRGKRKRTRTILTEYREYWQKGLPIEIKELDKKSAKVFASLLEEEGYDHYEARVMLAGEQGTGKTTIARYLVGKGPTKIRMSTDGIDLYNGLSFIDRETEEWMHGKQGFTLSEVVISRSLRQIGDKSSNMNAKYKLTERGNNTSDTPGRQEILRRDNTSVIPFNNESGENVISVNESSVFTREEQKLPKLDSDYSKPYMSFTETTFTNESDSIGPKVYKEIPGKEVLYIRSEKDPGLVQDTCLKNKYSSSFGGNGKAPVSGEGQTETKATKETPPVIPGVSGILPRDKEVVTLKIIRPETIPNSSDDNMVPLNESNISANEKRDFSRKVECHSKPHIESQEISTTTEVIKDRGIIAKFKKLFGVQKEVPEIKVSMTKDRFLEESRKVGKKKIHQKKIAPIIIWDFGGQDVFYSTHQTFLTYRAIYLLVIDGSRTLDDPCPFEQYLPGKSGGKTARDYLRFWINTIVTYCKGSGPGFPKIMIVLTHKDKLKAVEVEPRRQQIFHDIEKMFSGSPLLSHLVIKEQLFVNAKDKQDPEMAKIKKVITEQAMTQPTWGQNLPKCFIPLEWEFDSLLNRNIPLITMEQMERINSLQPVRPLTEKELKVFLKFQHSVGRILYFDIARLDQHIILSPTHLIDAFKSIVTDRSFCKGDQMRQESWDLMSKKGIMEKQSIEDIWKKQKYNKFQDHKEYLLEVMTYLDILVEPKRYDKAQTRIPAEFYYVASMVRTNDTTGYLMSPTFTQSNIAIAFSHSSSMIPPALSFRFISYCLSIFAVKKYGQNNDEMLFHMSAVFKIDQSLDMCVNCDDEIIVVRLVHSRNRTLITRDLASSIRECLAVALEKISQLYVKTSSTDCFTSGRSFSLSFCCSSSDDPCLLPLSTLQQTNGSWICPKHGIEHTKDIMSSWELKTEDVHCGITCPVTDTEFLEQIPSDIHLRRLSMQYSINETKELAMHLGMDYQTWDDLHVTFGEEPERLKFEALIKTVVGTHLTFNDIRKAVEFDKVRSIHSLCKVVRGNLIDFDQEPEKWDLVPTEEHLDRVAPLVGNNSLSFLVELGLEFRTWEEIKYRQSERDLVKLNRYILQEWKTNFCSFHNIRPSLRDIGKAFNNIGKNIRIIENVLADLL